MPCLYDNRNIIFISGHLHISPFTCGSVDYDQMRNNLYINDGSVCKTTIKDASLREELKNGNIVRLDLDETGVAVSIQLLNSGETISAGRFEMR